MNSETSPHESHGGIYKQQEKYTSQANKDGCGAAATLPHPTEMHVSPYCIDNAFETIMDVVILLQHRDVCLQQYTKNGYMYIYCSRAGTSVDCNRQMLLCANSDAWHGSLWSCVRLSIDFERWTSEHIRNTHLAEK